MNSESVTLIIPTFRRPKLLRRALASVSAQSYRNLKICVYDNCSGDETPQVVQEFAKKDPRIQYFCREKNIGSEANFRLGIESVQTPYFSLLSDDDALMPNCIEYLVGLLSKNPHVAFAYGNSVHLDEDLSLIGLTYSSDKEVTFYPKFKGTLQYLSENFPMFSTGGVYRKSAVEKVGNIDPNIYLLDFDFFIRLTMEYPCVLSSKPTGFFINNPSGASNYLPAKAFFASYAAVYKKLKNGALNERQQNELIKALESNAMRIWQLKLINAIHPKYINDLRQYIDPPIDFPFHPDPSVRRWIQRARLCKQTKMGLKGFQLLLKLRRNYKRAIVKLTHKNYKKELV